VGNIQQPHPSPSSMTSKLESAIVMTAAGFLFLSAHPEYDRPKLISAWHKHIAVIPSASSRPNPSAQRTRHDPSPA